MSSLVAPIREEELVFRTRAVLLFVMSLDVVLVKVRASTAGVGADVGLAFRQPRASVLSVVVGRGGSGSRLVTVRFGPAFLGARLRAGGHVGHGGYDWRRRHHLGHYSHLGRWTNSQLSVLLHGTCKVAQGSIHQLQTSKNVLCSVRFYKCPLPLTCNLL